MSDEGKRIEQQIKRANEEAQRMMSNTADLSLPGSILAAMIYLKALEIVTEPEPFKIAYEQAELGLSHLKFEEVAVTVPDENNTKAQLSSEH